jgi:dihydrofolate synthase / folylpolyglutamate synthase
MIISEFTKALSYLEQFIPDPKNKLVGNIGFDRMKELCRHLGNPEISYPIIHVGGTSGKGSTSTFIASILGTKYKTGLYTSPHLIRVNERIKIINKGKAIRVKGIKYSVDISDEEFVEILNYIIPFIEKMKGMELGPPSYFEIITAMSFLYFKLQKVDIAVIEVGMGGKYDATNVVKPEVAVITNIGFDHMEFLGNTVEKIAEEKAGIIKQGIQVVSGVKQKDIIKVIESRIPTSPRLPPSSRLRRTSRGAGTNHESRLSLLGRDFKHVVLSINEKGSSFHYSGDKIFKNLKIGMVGKHQVENASIALRAIEISNFQFPISNFNIRNGLRSAFIPGRFEIVNQKPLVILDGAHNPDKIRALVNTIQTVFPGKRATVIIAIKNDKNAKEMISAVMPITKKLIFTKYIINNDLGKINSYNPSDLSKIVKSIDKRIIPEIIKNPIEAVKTAITGSDKRDIILVTGSLYLIGEIKKHYENKIFNAPKIR